MASNLRPELSKKNKYWIDKNRFYELKYFCLQYPLWKKAYEVLDGIHICSYELSSVKSGLPGDTIGDCVEERLRYLERMKTVEDAAIESDPYLASYILKAVTEGLSFTYLQSVLEISCSRDTYYDRYRRFFWLLDNKRNSYI